MRHAHHPLALLAAVTAIAGLFSAFLVNDAICLVLAPLVLELTLSLRRNPVPYLLAVAMASNIGSTATITGNPQNMMIGSFSQIPYAQFTASLAPVALVGLVLTFVLIALFHRGEFAGSARLATAIPPARTHRALMLRALIATAVLVALSSLASRLPRLRSSSAGCCCSPGGSGASASMPRSTGRCW
jgi:Na+/H+ antiporter NhaD/arsenite permease-like protein